ncbi:MAG: DUF935 family protein [Kiritimatiellaeota bacterium]|nr:DUF935 family protein [Kiritimatiellota bacterium]
MARKPTKRSEAMGASRVAGELQMRFNPLRGITPSRLVSALDAWERGLTREMALIIDAYEQRDDMMRTCSRKMAAAVARCPDTVLIVEGEERNPEAIRHKQTLTRFWANVEATSAFRRNERGGIRLLKKQMASAESRGFCCHEIVWLPRADGTVRARFIHVPCEYFENTTGRLRFIADTGALYGVDMPDGEWLVTCGAGVGIAGAVAAMSKRLTLNDWLMYSERCGMPGLQATTSAQPGSRDWEAALEALNAFGRRWAALTSDGVKFNPVSLAASGTLPYPELVEAMNKAIAALYRGADLSTISAGRDAEGTGASVQGDETSLLEADTCEMISETLQQQVDRYVILYTHGTDTPLAYTAVAPVERPNAEMDMKVDAHLAALGARLSKNEALRRYQRTEADPKDKKDAALVPAAVVAHGVPAVQASQGRDALPNEAPLSSSSPAVHGGDGRAAGTPLQFARGAPEGAGQGEYTPEGDTPEKQPLRAFLGDLRKWRGAAAELMADPSPEKARKLLEELDANPSALARAMEEWIARGFSSKFGVRSSGLGIRNSELLTPNSELLPNEAPECRAKDPAQCPTHGSPSKNGWTDEERARNTAAVHGLAEEALKDRRSDKTVSLGKISGSAVGDIKGATGIDVSGYEQTISARDIRHADTRHGARERSKGQVPLGAGDYDRIPEVYSGYDSIEKGTPEGRTGLPTVRYKKRFGDGTLVAVEAIADNGDKRMRFKTMWKEKPKK